MLVQHANLQKSLPTAPQSQDEDSSQLERGTEQCYGISKLHCPKPQRKQKHLTKKESVKVLIKTFGRAGRAQSMESPPHSRNFKSKLRRTGVVLIFKSQDPEHYLHCFIYLFDNI